MIEQGIVQLVQADPTVAALCAKGGFLAQLPANCPLPNWSYIYVSNAQGYTLGGAERHKMRRLQLDVYGSTGAQAILLGKAIDSVLSGWSGSLLDPDHTIVQGIFQTDLDDFFDDAATSFRRMLEYEVHYQQ